jgi:type VI secretion system lysozyme-like protein
VPLKAKKRKVFFMKPQGTFLPPLFDRLSREGTVLFNVKEMKISVQEELSRLFNTRYALQPYVRSLAANEDMMHTSLPAPLAYGLEDFATRTAADESLLCETLESLIQLFEPRLKKPQVAFGDISHDRQEYTVNIKGQLVLGEKTIQVSFPVAMKKNPT